MKGFRQRVVGPMLSVWKLLLIGMCANHFLNSSRGPKTPKPPRRKANPPTPVQPLRHMVVPPTILLLAPRMPRLRRRRPPSSAQVRMRSQIQEINHFPVMTGLHQDLIILPCQILSQECLQLLLLVQLSYLVNNRCRPPLARPMRAHPTVQPIISLRVLSSPKADQ